MMVPSLGRTVLAQRARWLGPERLVDSTLSVCLARSRRASIPTLRRGSSSSRPSATTTPRRPARTPTRRGRWCCTWRAACIGDLIAAASACPTMIVHGERDRLVPPRGRDPRGPAPPRHRAVRARRHRPHAPDGEPRPLRVGRGGVGGPSRSGAAGRRRRPLLAGGGIPMAGLLVEPVSTFVDDLTEILGNLRSRAKAAVDADRQPARRRARGAGRDREHDRGRRQPERQRAARVRRGARAVVRLACAARRRRRSATAPRSASTARSRSRRRRCSRPS